MWWTVVCSAGPHRPRLWGLLIAAATTAEAQAQQAQVQADRRRHVIQENFIVRKNNKDWANDFSPPPPPPLRLLLPPALRLLIVHRPTTPTVMTTMI